MHDREKCLAKNVPESQVSRFPHIPQPCGWYIIYYGWDAVNSVHYVGKTVKTLRERYKKRRPRGTNGGKNVDACALTEFYRKKYGQEAEKKWFEQVKFAVVDIASCDFELSILEGN